MFKIQEAQLKKNQNTRPYFLTDPERKKKIRGHFLRTGICGAYAYIRDPLPFYKVKRSSKVLESNLLII